ncbi:MAG: CsgG/HfaB family protein [Candidatus Marinimicrobia bacterium]|jgi:WD40 repeat protein|nr:CsgG/HfaB family protein [Candidatus Neomarinimicrobiota bacterium]MDP7527112.1 CsgG/HfaB family protein [Candidatus Neomarinimicrobiota bacterium]|tara:strand:+ start:207 stop:1676 length:1470 start_codon:yes stop_codon:yes gene_type:complete
MKNNQILIKIIFLSLLLICFITNNNISAAEKSVMMVSVEMEGFETNTQNIVENRVIYVLKKTNMYNMIERSELKTILAEQALSMAGLLENKSEEKIGKLIGADLFLFVHISRFEEFYTLDFKLIDNVTSEILNSVSTESAPTMVSILNKIPEIIIELIDHSEETITVEDIPMRGIRLNPSVSNITPKATYHEHDDVVVDLISKGQIFYSVEKSGKILRWNPLENFFHELMFSYPYWNFYKGALSISGGYLAVAGDEGIVYLWDTKRWGNPFQLKKSKHRITSLIFSMDESHIFTGNEKGVIDAWDVVYQKSIFSKPLFSSKLVSLIENNDGQGIFASDIQGQIKLFHIDNREINFTENTRQTGEQIISSNHKGTLIISISNDGMLQVWDKSPYSQIRSIGENWIKPELKWRNRISLNKVGVNVASFAPADDILLIGCQDGSIIALDILTWRIIARNDEKGSSITAIQFLNNQQFITGHKDGKIMYWIIN